ncbi:MAG: hypothetical protein D6782_02945 [Alphaproteobacteria bacterium]|nr:MAG: hypothetical protein D6782_02945 [Alphaproteobacteria bacterium]
MDDREIKVTTLALARVEEELGEPVGAIAARWDRGEIAVRDMIAFARHASVPPVSSDEEAARIVDGMGISALAETVASQLVDVFGQPGKRKPRRKAGG